MTQWHNKGMVAAVHGHQIEIINSSAIVGIGTEFSCTYTLEQMRQLRDLYEEACAHMAAAAPAAKPESSVELVYKDGDAEPIGVTYVRDVDDDYWKRTADGWVMWSPSQNRWFDGRSTWSYITEAFGPLTVVDGDDPDMPWNR